MFKKFISSLIIFSLFYTDVANAMQSGDLDFHDDTKIKVRSLPQTQSPRRVKSSGDLTSSQELPRPFQQVSLPQNLVLPTSSSHSTESPPKGSLLSSSQESGRKSDDEGNATFSTKSLENSSGSPDSSPLKNSSNDNLPKSSPDASSTGSLRNELFAPLNSRSPSQEDVSLPLDQNQTGSGALPRGEEQQKPAILVPIVANPPAVPGESDQEDKRRVSSYGSIQGFNVHDGSFTLQKKRGSVLDAALFGSAEEEERPTERSSLLKPGSKRSSVQGWRGPENDTRLSEFVRDCVIIRKDQNVVQKRPFFPQKPDFQLRGIPPTLLGFLSYLPINDEITIVSVDDEHPSIPQDERPLGRINAEGLEEGMALIVNPKAISAFLKDIDNFPPHAKAFLSRLINQEIEGKLTKTHWIAIALGTLLGGGLAVAMEPVYAGGLVYIKDLYKWNWLNELIDSDNSLHKFLFTYVISTIVFDAVPRNVSSMKNAFTFLKDETGYTLRIWRTMLSVILPSLTEPFYLILLELNNMDVEHVSGINNQFAIAMMVLCPFLFIDSMASNFDTAWELWDDVKEWAQISPSSLAHCLPKSLLPSFENPLVSEFKDKLTKLSHFLKWCPEGKIKDMYQEVFTAKGSLQFQFPELEEKALDHATAFLVTRYLLALGDQPEEGTKRAKSWYETLSETVTYGTLALGSPFRMLVLELILETIFGLFSPKLVSQIFGWGLAAVGFPIQTALEYKGMKSLSNEILWEENPSGHSSHPIFRKGITAGSLMQALIFTVPLGVLALQATNIWFENDWWLAMSIPFLFGEFATLTTQFNSTYNRKLGTAITKTQHKLISCVKCAQFELCTPCKRDKLIRLVNKNIQTMSDLSQEVLQKLEETLHLEKEPNDEI